MPKSDCEVIVSAEQKASSTSGLPLSNSSVSGRSCVSRYRSSTQEMHNDRDESEHKQNVNDSAGNVKRHKSEQPHH